MPHPSRRTILASAASLAAAAAVPAPVAALLAPLPADLFRPSALLLEHRRLAACVAAIEAIDPLEHLYAMDAAGLLPHTLTSEEIEAITDPPLARQRAAINAHMPGLVAVSRAIWATPAASWHDVVARAELVAFWGRPLFDEDDHGHDVRFAEKKLVDAIASVATTRGAYTPLPAFEPPPLLLEYRSLDERWERQWLQGNPTSDERLQHIMAKYQLEFALLERPATCWADTAIRAELTAHHRRDCDEESGWLEQWGNPDLHDAFAELLVAVMRLGHCVWPIDISEVYWEQTNCELWERARAKSRVRHAEVVALRKAWHAGAVLS